MKSLISLMVLLCPVCYAQTFQEKIQGTWVCTAVTDSLGNKALGEFGGTNNYLKFTFKDKRLFIALAPFDAGIPVKLIFGNDYFEQVKFSFSQNRYTNVSKKEDDLILRTVNDRGKTIDYHFANQTVYAKNLDLLSNYRDVGKIILSVAYLKYFDTYLVRTSYLMDNSILNLIPCPQFDGREFSSLGKYFDSKLFLPTTINRQDFLNEFVIEFNVSGKGIDNIVLAKSAGYELDDAIINAIRNISNKWSPLVYNGKVIDTRIKLTFSFSYQEY